MIDPEREEFELNREDIEEVLNELDREGCEKFKLNCTDCDGVGYIEITDCETMTCPICLGKGWKYETDF